MSQSERGARPAWQRLEDRAAYLFEVLGETPTNWDVDLMGRRCLVNKTMSSTEHSSYYLGLLCIREGKDAGIKQGQIVVVQAETPTSWEIELVEERRLVSKLTGQIRGDWDSPWFTLTVIEPRKKNMLSWLCGRLKWWIAGKELAELHRWRVQWHEYRRWLAEFKEVGEALDSMKANVEGQRLDACLPPTGEGPWTVEGVRARARAMRHPRNK